MNGQKSDPDTRSRDSETRPNVRPYQQEDVLRELYHEEGLSQAQIGERFGVSQMTICNWMDRHDIQTRPPMCDRDRTVNTQTREDGRMRFFVPDFDDDGEPIRVRFFRYQADALRATDDDGDWLYTIGDVFGNDTHVHHQMADPIPVDIPENLEVLTNREHAIAHGGFDAVEAVEMVLGEIFDDYQGEPSQDEIQDSGDVDMEDSEHGRIDVDAEAD